MAEIDIHIAARHYKVACRDGEEQNLRHAAELVDAKAREALAGLGALSESRTMLFASLLLADQLIEKRAANPAAAAPTPPPPAVPDPQVIRRVDALAERLERLAGQLEKEAASA